MPSDDDIKRDLAEILAKHGVTELPREMTKGHGAPKPSGLRASYITEIITDSQEFDEKVLERVTNVLRRR